MISRANMPKQIANPPGKKKAAAIKAMPASTYAASTEAKRKASRSGKQFSKQPTSTAKIAKKFR